MKSRPLLSPLGLLLGCSISFFGTALAQIGRSDTLVAVNQTSPETNCLQAQKLIGAYDQDTLALKASLTAHSNVEEFINSKPQIKSGKLSIQVYTPTLEQAQSEYPQLWCKLKSAADIARNSSTLGLPSLGASKNCDLINKDFFEQLLATNPDLKTAFKESGYSINFVNQSFYTGFQWAPSVPTIALTETNQITVTTTSLESSPGIPVIGGMNYCKFIAPEGLSQLIQDLTKGDLSDFSKIKLTEKATPLQVAGPLVSFQTVSLPSDLNGILTRKADLYWPKTPAVGVYILSPGGSVAPLAMRSLARQIAEQGHGVFVVHYPMDLAIFEKLARQKNTAYLYAQIIKNQTLDTIENLPAPIKNELLSQKLPVRLFGHSLGGAILGDTIFGDHKGPFDQMILYGTLSFVQSGQSTSIGVPNLQLLFGENDGLSFNDPKALKKFAEKYGFTDQVSTTENRIPGQAHSIRVISELNHFCIINEMTTGSSLYKNWDRPGPAPSTCLPQLIGFLKANQWL